MDNRNHNRRPEDMYSEQRYSYEQQRMNSQRASAAADARYRAQKRKRIILLSVLGAVLILLWLGAAIAIVKAVSDDGSRMPSANEVTALLRSYREDFASIFEKLARIPEKKDYMPLDPSVMDELRLTQYMRCEFEDLVHYCVVSNKTGKLKDILEEMRSSGILPVSDKRQGRRVLDEIFARLR